MDDASMVKGPAQHLHALELANRVRRARSELKRRIASGELDPAEVITACPLEAHTMEIAELLRSQRRWGDTRCRRFLTPMRVPETKRIGTMTDRQREELVKMLSAAGRPDEVGVTPVWATRAA